MQYHLHIPKLQERYGDFIRTGPREVTVIRASAVDLIYGPSSKCTKATWYDQNSGDPDKVGIENVRDKEKHRIRRRAWDRGMGLRAVSMYGSRIKSKVDSLMLRFDTGEPVNVTQDVIFYAWDVMGDIAFSVDFQMLHTGVEHPAVDGLHWAMATAGVVTNFPWLMNMLRVIPGATGRFQQFADWCYEQVDVKRDALAREKAEGSAQEPRDVMSWIIKAQQDGDRSAPPTESAIREDARTLISAGRLVDPLVYPLEIVIRRDPELTVAISDTVAIAFTNLACKSLIYGELQSLLHGQEPPVYQKLQRLLDAEFPQESSKDWTYEKAKKIPYIDHLIHETLRLRPPAPMGFPRETPPAGLQVDDVFIPGGVNVNVPTWAIQRDERYFARALDFVPERWMAPPPESAAAYLPFQRGPFQCSGKAVAMMQMRMLIGCIALRYNLAFASGEDGEAFWEGAKETMTLWLPPLRMVFEPR
ncbi:uncharacterized protein PG986_000541 [Apiospora aurea]|uniref:Cytochrome P450 n=1 Tax=Apiospora aurea TaxID=335848 RepID=A0ABR1QUD7_9PEZI